MAAEKNEEIAEREKLKSEESVLERQRLSAYIKQFPKISPRQIEEKAKLGRDKDGNPCTMGRQKIKRYSELDGLEWDKDKEIWVSTRQPLLVRPA